MVLNSLIYPLFMHSTNSVYVQICFCVFTVYIQIHSAYSGNTLREIHLEDLSHSVYSTLYVQIYSAYSQYVYEQFHSAYSQYKYRTYRFIPHIWQMCPKNFEYSERNYFPHSFSRDTTLKKSMYVRNWTQDQQGIIKYLL